MLFISSCPAGSSEDELTGRTVPASPDKGCWGHRDARDVVVPWGMLVHSLHRLFPVPGSCFLNGEQKCHKAAVSKAGVPKKRPTVLLPVSSRATSRGGCRIESHLPGMGSGMLPSAVVPREASAAF